MKYLNIHQSILKADNKYTSSSYCNNTFKSEFNKYFHTCIWNNDDGNVQFDDNLLISIFEKYMNDDIWINWNK
jgi:hypothetical protein